MVAVFMDLLLCESKYVYARAFMSEVQLALILVLLHVGTDKLIYGRKAHV